MWCHLMIDGRITDHAANCNPTDVDQLPIQLHIPIYFIAALWIVVALEHSISAGRAASKLFYVLPFCQIIWNSLPFV